jgi:Na+-transporting NADH:ubiquinone oxidoreductase subunit F
MIAALSPELLEVGAGVVLFTAIVMCLVLVVLFARSRLVQTGTVEIVVNERISLTADVGRRLLTVLTENAVRVPSGCGGTGTCGMCRVTVVHGGGAPLPVETARLLRRQVADGQRLACQLTIRQDLVVEVPDEILGVREFECVVRANRNVATFIKELQLDLPEGESLDFFAGAFVELHCPAYRAAFRDFDVDVEFRDEWDRLDLWRYEAGAARPTSRAYSLANYRDEPGPVKLIVRIATPPPGASPTVPPGVVSSYVFSLRPGDRVSISGPFGNFAADDSEREMVVVGGGAGMAPLRAHILDQLVRLRSSRKIGFWYGARSRREIFYAEEFDRLQAEHDNFRWHVALSEPRPGDGWRGSVGFIHGVLAERYLRDHPAPEDCEYYLCGPPMMIRATRQLLDQLGVAPENVHFDDFGGQ